MTNEQAIKDYEQWWEENWVCAPPTTNQFSEIRAYLTGADEVVSDAEMDFTIDYVLGEGMRGYLYYTTKDLEATPNMMAAMEGS